MTFEFEKFPIYQDEASEDGFPTVLCEVDLMMVEPASFGSMPSLNDPGEPGYDAVFEIHEVRLTDVPADAITSEDHINLTLSETQFITFFSNGQDVVNNAYEWAAEHELCER